MKKANKVEYTDDPYIDQLTGAVTLNLHLRSEKGNRRSIRVTLDQYDMRHLAKLFYEGLERVEHNLTQTREYLAGER